MSVAAGGLSLRLESLEHRTLLDAGGLAAPAPAPATHFALLAPANETAGHSAPLELVALDASNHVARNFTGTVTFSSSDTGATLPVDYTFTAHDRGRHLFQITLATPGSDTVTATDAADTISGDTTVNVDPAPVATHFLVYTPEDTTVGASTNVVVVALDASNHRVSDYAGTVNLTTSDPGVTTPVSYAFTSSDHGVHVFQETFATMGVQTVTATDAANSALTGTASLNVNPAPVATHFAVLTRGPIIAGTPFSLEVVALDASNHRVPDYAGTIHFTSSATGDTLPADYTFAASDQGKHLFQVTLANAGSDTLTVSDGTLSGSVAVTVHGAPPPPTSSGPNGGANSHASRLAGWDAFFAAFAAGNTGWHWRH
jgi:hypothetical protein